MSMAMAAYGLQGPATGRAEVVSAWSRVAAPVDRRPMPPSARGCARGRLLQGAPEAP